MSKPMRSERRQAQKLQNLSNVRTTLGELIVAAFDAVGSEFYVAQLLGSRELSRAAHARIVLQ